MLHAKLWSFCSDLLKSLLPGMFMGETEQDKKFKHTSDSTNRCTPYGYNKVESICKTGFTINYRI